MPKRRWYGDITCISTWAGLTYLTNALDCYNKKIAGYDMVDHALTSLVYHTIDMLVRGRAIEKHDGLSFRQR